MPVRRRLFALLLTATASIGAGCARHTEAAATPPPVLSEANKAKAYAVGLQLAAQDRAADKAHRAEMARLIDATVVRTYEQDRTLSLLLRLQNKSAKAIRGIGAGLEVHARSGKRLGLAEIDDVPIRIAPHGFASVWLPIRYVRFGEDAGTMRLAAGKAKQIDLQIVEVRYADGSDAGYDD
jgi:hypothetical protein